MSPFILRAVEAAAAAASTSNASQYKIGAIVVKRKELISVGVNVVYHKIDRRRKSDHAEDKALKRVQDPCGTDIFVVRVNRSGQFRLSRPCKKCWKHLLESGVKRVYYSTSEGTLVREWIKRDLPKKIYSLNIQEK